MSSGGVSPTTGLRVLELGPGRPGALAGMVLADYGADVIKVEPPAGDPDRGEPAFLMWNRGKHSVAADLGEETGRERVRALASAADVVIVTGPARRAESLGLGYAELRARRPEIILCEITGFGAHTAYAHYPPHEGVVAARAGRMLELSSLCGGERPAFSAVPVASYGAAQLALQGVLAALLERERSGLGQHVQTSLLQALTAYELVNWLPGVTPSVRLEDAPYVPYLAARTRDGVWLQFAQLSRRQFDALLRHLELNDIRQDPRFRHAPALADPEDMRALRALLLERIQRRTYREWCVAFDDDPDLAVERFRTTAEAFDHPQFRHNVFCPRSDPRVGSTLQLAPLVELSESPATVTGPAPELGSCAAKRWKVPPPAAPPSRPLASEPHGRVLDGVLVLELATWVAAPFAATLLADLGARVIKIEPMGGEPFRQVMGGLPSTKTVMGKESLAIDLKTPEAREIVHALARKADVLIHNYRPGVPERLGIDAPTLRALNPRLIYAYAASYGSTGPLSHRPAYHPTAGAACGGALEQAGEGMPPAPQQLLDPRELAHVSRHLEVANDTNPDPTAALAGATAVLLALLHRARTGIGQVLETTMMRSNAYALSADCIDHPGRPPRRRPDAELRGRSALEQLYETREGWVFLGCPYPEEFERLCTALGRRAWLSDPRFATREARREHDGELAEAIASVLRERHADRLEEELTKQGLGCVRADRAPFASFLYDDPGLAESGLVVEVESELWGRHRRFAPPVRLSRDSGEVRGAGTAGRETRAILIELGYPENRIRKLANGGVVSGPDLR
ncbi:MAG: CaiB/BaiF CoA transferase family protein [Myxococcota bacterium]